MGLISGYILLVIIALLCIKFISKRVGNKAFDRFSMRIHKPLAYSALILVIMHAILTFQVFNTRPILLYIVGIMMIVVGVGACVGHRYLTRLGKKWIGLHRITAILMLVLLALHMVIYFIDFSSYRSEVSEIEVTDIDVSSVADGTYIGSYDVGYIYAKVEVTVESGMIKEIKLLEHKNERGEKSEKITDTIKEKQSITVDTVSGATNSSKVIQMAIYSALTNN